MIGSIILGMGLPTAVAYIIAAIVACPALIELGLLPISCSHVCLLFCYFRYNYPPVCLSVYVASGIAQSNWLKTAYYAILMALPGFIIPYVFVYDHSILMIGTPSHILRTSITAFIGIFALAPAMMGYFLTRINFMERILLMIASILLIFPNFKISLIGVIILISVYFYQKFKKREEIRQFSESKA